tara:strand:+ start:1888 stop:3078 length:1191 start_codon:yes stop_codon:yes gene_type:complete
LNRAIITGIDIRPDRVVCLIAHELEIVNQGTFLQLIGHGITEFPIDCTDPLQYSDEELEKYIRQSIDKAETESNESVKDAYVSIYDNNESIYIDQEIELGNEIVSDKVINLFFKQEEFKSLYSEIKEPLHSFPISHKINNSKSVSDPIGLKVNNLKTRWHIIMTDSDRLNKLRNIFENIDISVRQFIANAYTSCISTLSEEESSNGSTIIDIGKNFTFISYVFDNNLISFQKIPIGTLHISRDISQLMNIDLLKADALRKKLNTSNEENLDDQFEIDSLKVFNSRCEELVELIQKVTNSSKYFYLVDKNIVITGKGSKSAKLISKIKNKLGANRVRLGVAQKFNGLKTIISNPSLSSSFGLLAYASDHVLQIDESHSQNIQKKSIFSYIYNFFASI